MDIIRVSCGTENLNALIENEERQFQIERANFAARSALSRSQSHKSSASHGGRGGYRPKRSNGSGHSKGSTEKTTTTTNDEESAGEKRKRAIEPDGGPDVGVRGQGVPLIKTIKKTKTENSAA